IGDAFAPRLNAALMVLADEGPGALPPFPARVAGVAAPRGNGSRAKRGAVSSNEDRSQCSNKWRRVEAAAKRRATSSTRG
ncbi:MAG TPA: hypothetical protein VFU81_04570, partial [Thermomicrobiales bacterium]|nr:hypothetical protein [Thermomicrobiales bacterium]